MATRPEIEIVERLTKPIKNCRAILEQLSVKLARLRNSHLESHNVRSGFVDVKWSLFSKNKISKLQQTLEAEKLTVGVALNVIIMQVKSYAYFQRRADSISMRVLTLAEENRVVLEVRTGGNSDASTVMSPFHITRGTPILQLSTPRLCDHSDIEKTVNDIETTYISMNQISESLKTIVQSTQYAVMFADRLLH